MSETIPPAPPAGCAPVSPLGGQRFRGAVEIADAGLRGMITIKGDQADSGFCDVVTAVSGTVLPGPRQIAHAGGCRLAWMGPDELLLILPQADVTEALARLSAGLAGHHHLVVDVSDARAVLRLTGQCWREVLAKGAPVDLSPRAFGPGDFRRTRMGQIAVAFWMISDTEAELVCLRSVAAFCFEWLSVAAAEDSLPGFLANN